jgi:hypothetical protein
MALSDNELQDIFNENPDVPKPVLGSATPTQLSIGAGPVYGPVPQRGLSLEELANLPDVAPVGFGKSFGTISGADIDANRRYPIYDRNMPDIENLYAENQPWYEILGKGVAKLGINTVGTLAQSLTNIPNAIDAYRTGAASELSGDPDGYEGAIDNWMKNMNETLPNYASKYVQDHPFLSAIPFMKGNAYWWGEKFMPNLGFMVGSVGGAVVQDVAIGAVTEGIGEIPLLANQIGRASLYLNKLFTGTNTAERLAQIGKALGKTEGQILKLDELARLSAAAKAGKGFRATMGVIGSAMTEAGVNSRNGYSMVKDELIRQHTLATGGEPDAYEMQDIENKATNAMNVNFGVNMALLTVSNALQFGNLFRSMAGSNTSRAISGPLTTSIAGLGKIGLAEGSLDVFEKKTADTILGKVWDSIKPKGADVIREGVFEEGGQFAAERGTYDYYTRKYHSDKYKQQWNGVNELINSTVYGLKEQFGSTEGLENMLIGGVTGLVVGGAQGFVDKRRGVDTDKRLATAISILNTHGITNTLQNQYDGTVTSAGIAKDMQEAAASGDVFKYKNLQADEFFNLVSSRLASGMHDVTIEQLQMLKGLSKEDFEKTFQLDFNQTNKETVNDYVDALIDKANDIKTVSDVINNTFTNPFKLNYNAEDPNSVIDSANHITFENYKKDLTYFAAMPSLVDSRVNSIQQSISKVNPFLSTEMIGQLTDFQGLTDMAKFYEEQATILKKSITELTPAAEKKKINDKIKALRTRSERIAEALRTGKIDDKMFDSILNFELNGQDATKPNVVSIDRIQELMDYSIDINRLLDRKKKASKAYDELSSKEGFLKYFDEAKKMASDKDAVVNEEEIKEEEKENPTEEKTPTTAPKFQFKNSRKQLENIEADREYETMKIAPAKVNKVDDDRWQVISPDGTYEILPTKEKAEERASELNDEFKNLRKFKVIGLNENGTIKIEDANDDIYDIDPRRMLGFQKVETEQEKLMKIASSLEKAQTRLEVKSGVVSTEDPSTEQQVKEPKKKRVDIFFTSSTDSVDDGVAPSKGYQTRTRQFLNNFKNLPNRSNIKVMLVTNKQSTKLGLTDFARVIYGETAFTEEEVNNVDTGILAAVYVEQDGSNTYFVDKDGKRLGKVGETVDMNSIVFSMMPTASLYYSYTDAKGNPVPRFRQGEEAEATAYKDAWSATRNKIFNTPGEEMRVYNFGISRGMAVEQPGAKNFVGDNLIPENKIANQENLIVISTTGTLAHNGENYNFPKGRPLLQYGDTLQWLNNRKFNANEAKSIFEALRLMSEDIQAKAKKGQPIEFNPLYANFLQNVLFWKKSSNTKNNQMYIDEKTMTLYLGGQKYNFADLASSEAAIIDKLKDTFNSINNDSIKNASDPFTELYFEDGYLKDRDWANYQSYLLSSKYPNGKNRAIVDSPLSTSVMKPTDLQPYNYRQKYITLSGMELEVKKVAKAEAPVAATKVVNIGGYDMDNATEHTKEIKNLGNVKFTARLDENGKILVTASSIENMDAIVGDIAKMTPYFDFLKKIVGPNGNSIFDATKTEEESMLQFASIALANQLDKMRETAPVETAPAAPTAPVVSEVKENIEKLDTLDDTVDDTEAAELQAKVDAAINAQLDALKATKGNRKRKFSTVTGVETPRMTDAELQLFKEWHAANVPNIPFEVLQQIISTHDGIRAWGVYENGVAKFYKSAARGTEYHEIFHGIFNGFLNEEQRRDVLDEFKSKPGKFKDRASGKMIFYEEATDEQAEERIADDFADFRLGKLPAKNLGEQILRFFRNIIQFVRDFVNKPSKKEELFKAIDAGKFKDAKLNPAVFNKFTQYSVIAGLNEKATNELVQDVTAQFFYNVFSSNASLYKPELLTAPEIFGEVKEVYTEDGKLDVLGEEGWNDLVKKTKEFLRTFKIEFDENQVININGEGANNRDYAPEPFSTDWKKQSSFPIKLVLGTLPLTMPTNQENSLSLNLPETKESDFGGGLLLNFSRAFGTAISKLSNTSSVGKLVNKLVDLAKSDSNYVRLFERLGGNPGTGEVATINFENFKAHDWRLFINFYQTFTKQNPNARVQYISGNEVYTGSADLYDAVSNVVSGWIEGIKALSKDDKSLIKYIRKQKVYTVGDLTNVKINTPEQMISFLNNIGIDMNMEVYTKFKDKEKNAFAKSVGGIYTSLRSKSDILSSMTGKLLDVEGPLSTIAEMVVRVTNPNFDSTHFNVEGERTNSFAENNTASVLENEWSEAGTLKKLKELRPELNDPFSTHSVLLKEGGLHIDADGNIKKPLKVGYIQGTKVVDDNDGITTSRLTLGNRFTQEINQNLNGRFYVLIPADSSTEWLMELGANVPFASVDSGKAWNKIYGIFQGYLKDDIALAKDADTRERLKNIGDRAYDLRFFKDILSDDMLAKINTEIVQKPVSDEDIAKFIAENEKEINEAVKSYIDTNVKSTINTLISTNQIIASGVEGKRTWSYAKMDSTFAKNAKINRFALTQDKLTNLITYANVNYIISNIEFHKVLFGDPYQFALKDGESEETKRIKSFLSPRRTTFDSPEYNTFLNNEFNKAGEIELKEGDPGYHKHKNHTNTVTIKEVFVQGRLMGRTKEADAQSWMMDTTHREVKLKNGQWTDEAEIWHQWQMAYTRNRLAEKGKYIYNNDKLKTQDAALIKNPEPKYVTEVMKPIVTGNKLGKAYFDVVLDKFSQMPLYYKAIEGTTLEGLYNKMMEEGYGYAIMESGRKMGTTEAFDLYKDGKLNTEPFNNLVQVPWKAYGIQVENSYETAKEQTRGSQGVKLSTVDLYDNGKPISQRAKDAVDRNNKILDLMHENAYNMLLEKLGIVDTGFGFKLDDNTAVSETLVYEMLRRQLSQNAKDTLQLDSKGNFRLPFEASPSYRQIRDILYSVVQKTLVSPKVSGGPKVQVSVTGWENLEKGRRLAIKTEEGYDEISRADYEKLSDAEKKRVVLTDDTLKFYTEADPYVEIMLPHWFREKLNKGRFATDADILRHLNESEEGKAILRGIGFRIPTQSLSSMVTFRVKGFLPQSMGDTVIVPSEITTLAGSDFDIDKLNTYLKAVYIDQYGDIRLVKYLGSEAATKQFFSEEFDRILSTKKVKKAELIEALNVLNTGADDVKGLLNKYSFLIDELIASAGDINDTVDIEKDIVEQLAKLEDADLQSVLKDRFVKGMYKKSLENEYYDSLEEVLTLPENFKRLTTPVDDAGLEKLAAHMDTLIGNTDANIPNKILDRNFMTRLRHAFVMAKRWVGIAAVNITSHSLTQKVAIYLDPKRTRRLPFQDRKFVGDGKILLPHNTVEIDGQKLPSLSGTKTANGKQFISNRLSGYGTAFVDVANKPYITKLITSELAVGTFMFLERLGVGETTAIFMNQPIIREYLKMLDNNDSKALFNKLSIEFIESKFVTTDADIANTTDLDIANFENNIIDYYKNGKKDLGNSRNAQQRLILKEFLKYAKLAEYNLDLTQAVNYDTTKYKSGDTLFKKQVRTTMSALTSPFANIPELLEKIFIGKQVELLDSVMEGMGAILKLESDEFRLSITDPLLTPYAANKYLGMDEFQRIANKLKSSFLDYIIQTKTGFNNDILELFVDSEKSVAKQLEMAKKISANPILNDLKVVSSPRPDGAMSVKLAVNFKGSAYDEDLYTGYMRELRDDPKTNTLYKNLVKMSILQGTYQNGITFSNIVPIEDYSAYITTIINTLTNDESLAAFKDGGFQRNNWKDPNVFKKFNPKFWLADEAPVGVEINDMGDDMGDIYFYDSPAHFPYLSNKFGVNTDRRILTLSEEYDSFYLNNDYILVPRVVETKTGRVDIKTGETVSNYTYVEMKNRGDLGLKDVYGYKKVYNDAGEPVTFQETNYKGETITKHVYKLINLYGDGNLVSEYYTDNRKSVLNNGTVKIDREIPDSDIITYFSEKSKQDAISLQLAATAVMVPTYEIDEKMTNKDGSKRFATTDGIATIKVNPPASVDEFFNYFEGKEGGATSVQKAKVLNKLAEKGYTLDVIKTILPNVNAITNFLVLHEQDHIDNNDKDVYWKNGKDLLTDDKIDIEVRATVAALEKLGGIPSVVDIEFEEVNTEDTEGSDNPNPCGTK